VCVCAMLHLARNVLQYVTDRHDYIGGCVTEITTLKKDILQKLLVAHLVKKSSTSDGL
jgi:CO dehydrogenase nickel-insertion accessory protein CooC1